MCLFILKQLVTWRGNYGIKHLKTNDIIKLISREIVIGVFNYHALSNEAAIYEGNVMHKTIVTFG